LQDTLFASLASFTFWFHHGVDFLPLFTTPSYLRPHTRGSWWNYSCFEQLPLPFCVRYSAVHSRSSRNKDDKLISKVFHTHGLGFRGAGGHITPTFGQGGTQYFLSNILW